MFRFGFVTLFMFSRFFVCLFPRFFECVFFLSLVLIAYCFGRHTKIQSLLTSKQCPPVASKGGRYPSSAFECVCVLPQCQVYWARPSQGSHSGATQANTQHTERAPQDLTQQSEGVQVLSFSRASSVDWWGGALGVGSQVSSYDRLEGQSLGLVANPSICIALGVGSSIVHLRCSASVDLARWEPHAHQLLHMGACPGQSWLALLWCGVVRSHPKGALVTFQLASLFWLPGNPFCKVQRVPVSLRSLHCLYNFERHCKLFPHLWI